MLGSVRYSVALAYSSEHIWDYVGDPATIWKWFPDFSSSSVEGSTRTITTNSGFTIDEELLVVDSHLHRIQYRVNLPMLEFHRGTLDVIDTGENSCVVSYATDCEPRIMAMVIGAPTYRGLQELERQLKEQD